MRRILSIWFPHWPVERRLRGRPTGFQRPDSRATCMPAIKKQPSDIEVPFALVVKGARGVRIFAANLQAETEGVFSDQALADARALCPSLEIEEATPDLDAVALEQFALWCLRYSPLVRCHEPDGLALDITGCDHLFGGELEMMAQLTEQLTKFHLTVRIGLADTIGGAWAAARFGGVPLCRIAPGALLPFLRPLTIAALGLPKREIYTLKQLGLRHIGQLLDVPQSTLITRFGRRLTDQLSRVIEPQADIFNPLIPPALYQVNQSLMEPLTHLEGVYFCLQTLSEQMQQQLKADTKGARQLEMRLFRVDGYTERLCVRSRNLCDDAAYMQRLFEEVLANLKSDVDLGYGIDFMSLSAFNVENMAAEQQGWGKSARALDHQKEME